MTRPPEAIFVQRGSGAKPLAILPKAIGIPFGTYEESDFGYKVSNGVAVLCIEGPLQHKPGWFLDYEAIAAIFCGMCRDGSVRAILLKFDSPGGEVAGLNETVKYLQQEKSAARKPVIGYVDESCFSAAYALSTVCDEIYLPPSASLGSIGVITAMADCTEADKAAGLRIEVIASGSKKTDGHPHVPLSDGAIARAQKTVDQLADEFFSIVSEARGLSVEEVRSFQAGTFLGQDAVDVGLANGVMSLQECLTLSYEQFSQTKTVDVSAVKKGYPMRGQLAAAKSLKDATAALAAAKTDGERAVAAARIVAAETELAKVTRLKTTDKTVHTEEVDDGEGDDSSSGSSMDDSDDEEVDAKYEKESAAAAAFVATKGKTDLLNLCRQITGKFEVEEVMGALQGMHDGAKQGGDLAAKVARLEAEAEAVKVQALVESGIKAGKLTPAQEKWAKTQSVSALRAYLDAAPKVVATVEDELTEAAVSKGVGGVTAEMAKIWTKLGFKEADFPKLLETHNKGAVRTNGAS